MEANKIIKGIIWGVSTVIGLVVAEGIYRSSVSAIDRRTMLIGDGEIISEEIDDIDMDDIEAPFN